MKRILRRWTAALALCAALPLQAAVVNGSYQGTITTDSGLGLLGQSMVVNFSYDDTTPGADAFGAWTFTGALASLEIHVGAHTWIYDAVNGDDTILLYDDLVLSFTSGVEDRVQAFVGGFSGPTLGTGTANGFSFDLFLSDNVPSGTPDGLDDATSLAGIPPCPKSSRSIPARTRTTCPCSGAWGIPSSAAITTTSRPATSRASRLSRCRPRPGCSAAACWR